MRRRLALITIGLFVCGMFLNTFKEYFFSLDSNSVSQGLQANIYVLPFILSSWVLAIYVLVKEIKNGVNRINILLVLPTLTVGTIFLIVLFWMLLS